MVGAGLLAESCPVIVRTEEVEPGFGEVEQAFSSLTRFSPLAPVIGVRTMVQTSVNTEEPLQLNQLQVHEYDVFAYTVV